MSKDHDFGGIQQPTITDVENLVNGRGPKPPNNGLTDASAIGLLLALVGAQTNALNPGSGQAGFMDAYTAFDHMNTALENMKSATTAAAINAEAVNMIAAIKALNKLFANGPIPDGFFTIPSA